MGKSQLRQITSLDHTQNLFVQKGECETIQKQFFYINFNKQLIYFKSKNDVKSHTLRILTSTLLPSTLFFCVLKQGSTFVLVSYVSFSCLLLQIQAENQYIFLFYTFPIAKGALNPALFFYSSVCIEHSSMFVHRSSSWICLYNFIECYCVMYHRVTIL